MNKLLDDDGHLTDYALSVVVRGENLDELSRLEISEHLSFCDDCIVRYTEFLTGDVMTEPQESVVPSVMSGIRARARLIFFNKYVAVGMAASIAMVLWVTGVFTPWDISEIDSAMTGIAEKSQSIDLKTTKFIEDINTALQKIFDKSQKE